MWGREWMRLIYVVQDFGSIKITINVFFKKIYILKNGTIVFLKIKKVSFFDIMLLNSVSVYQKFWFIKIKKCLTFDTMF